MKTDSKGHVSTCIYIHINMFGRQKGEASISLSTPKSKKIYSTCVADFMPRQDAGKFMLGKYFSDKQIPWMRRRRLGMAVAVDMPTASQLTNIGTIQSAGCLLCRRV